MAATAATAVATATARGAVNLAVAIATAATAAAITQASDGLTLTAQQGDADHREENRHSKRNKTIHAKTSNYLQVP